MFRPSGLLAVSKAGQTNNTRCVEMVGGRGDQSNNKAPVEVVVELQDNESAPLVGDAHCISWRWVHLGLLDAVRSESCLVSSPAGAQPPSPQARLLLLLANHLEDR